jgi:hypothetical protein
MRVKFFGFIVVSVVYLLGVSFLAHVWLQDPTQALENEYDYILQKRAVLVAGALLLSGLLFYLSWL